MKFKNYLFNLYKVCITALLLCGTSLYVHGQQTSAGGKAEVSGTVIDETGLPIIGATIIEKGTTNGTSTNVDGHFNLNVSSNAVLSITYLGYKNLEIPVNGKKVVNATMAPGSESLEEVVVVGYGVQKKATLTGAISAIKGAEIVTTKNENLQNSLAGKIAGVRVTQNTGEPGSFNTTFDIRDLGTPLVIIDGVPRSNMTRIDAQDVESISVLKDASAAVYGVRAEAGVVLITTKRGAGEKFGISYSGNFGWQIPSGFPDMTNAVDYMALANEKSMHKIDNPKWTYTQAQIDDYKNGTKQSTDWKEAATKNYAPETQHNIGISGSTDKTNYYLSMGYAYQGSFFNTDDYDYDRYNVRSNVSTKLHKNFKIDLNLSGIMDNTHRPNPTADPYWIVRAIWHRRPTDPVYANNTYPYYLKTAVTGDNPVAMINEDVTGYRNNNNKWFQSSVSATYDFPFLKGLQMKGLYSFDFNQTDNKIVRKTYNVYEYLNEKYITTSVSAPDQVRREYFSKEDRLWNVSLNYNSIFNKIHEVGALILFEETINKGDNFFAQRDQSMPLEQLFTGNSKDQIGNSSDAAASLYDIQNQAFVGRLNYAYNSKYLLELAFRYDGSSKFPDNYKWGFFPSASAGWRVSEESFWKESSLNFIDNLKLRASYGKMGNDKGLAYQFYQGYTYPASGSAQLLPGGYVLNGEYINSAVSKGIPNNRFTWTVSKTFNAGIDLDAWKGLFGFTAEYFQRNRDGLTATRILSLPDVIGVSLPQENLNGDRTQGFELELRHHNRINDFFYGVKGVLSMTRTMAMYVERAQSGSSYLNWRQNTNDRWNGIWWGYSGDNRYESWSDILNSQYFVGRGAVIGDYALEDWNGDGMISDLDVHPIASNNKSPMMNFGLTLDGSYKGFDLNLLFQGGALRSISYTELLREPVWNETGALEQFMDRWHPVDPLADPWDMNTKWAKGYYAYTGSLPDVNSTFNVQNASYLRLKSVELGYTIPNSIMKKLGGESARFYVNGYNLLTFTGLKYVDPEHPSDSYGYMYPINKTVSVGVNVKF